MRRHQLWVTRVGGLMLVLVGLLLLTGWWDQSVQWLQLHLVDDFQVERVNPDDRPTETRARPRPAPERRSGELNLRELLRWTWRQLTSMRIALILLLLLALAAVPGSLIPQERVDALKASQWQDAHETLTPIYEKLGLFNVYGSPWFAAIYILLVVSLVGCIVPRTFVYARAMRAQPPAAPRNLTRLPSHASYGTTESPEVVLERGPARCSAQALPAAPRGRRRDGQRRARLPARGRQPGLPPRGAGGAGRLRDSGTLFGYKGGVILVQGTPFGNNLTQYDDFVPGQPVRPRRHGPVHLHRRRLRRRVADVRPAGRDGARLRRRARATPRRPDGPEKSYDLRVNHPLTIGGTELFLIGHGYAPVVTVRDGEGNIAASGPVPFLPMGPDLFSFGVIKAADAKPGQIGLEGYFYPTFANVDGDPVNLGGNDVNPLLSLNVYTGDLNLDSGAAQSVYTLDKSQATAVPGEDGKPLRVDLAPGDTVELPERAGQRHLRQGRVLAADPDQPDARARTIALLGVVLALLGLMGSLFIRSRRVWLRVTEGAGRHPGRDRGPRPLRRRRHRRRTVGPGRRAAGGTAHDRRRVGHAEQPGGRGRRRSSTSSPCSRTSSSGRRCARSTGPRCWSDPAGSEATEPPARDPRSSGTGTGSRCSAGSGCCSPGIAVAVHLVALVGRGMSADPNRVPWGNMYEFTLAGTFVVAAFYLVLSRRYAAGLARPGGRHLRARPC